MQGAKLSTALLDWGKAFDNIQHDRLFVALERLGFSRHYVDVIKNCYRNPCFFVRDKYGLLQVKKQNPVLDKGALYPPICLQYPCHDMH